MTENKERLSLPLYNWHLEVSSKCTLKCPRCSRQKKNEKSSRMNLELSLKDIKRLFSPQRLKEEVRRITFCGNLGDPIYASEFVEIIKYLKEENPSLQVRIVTNGSYKAKSWWYSLGKALNSNDRVTFSIDGYDNESNNKYRFNSDFESAAKGLQFLRESSETYLAWATIVFSFNENYIERIKEIATSLGADEFLLTKSILFGDRFENFNDEFGKDPLMPSEVWRGQGGRYDVETYFLSKRRQDNSLYNKVLEEQEKRVTKRYRPFIHPLCLVGSKGLFVSADGQLWPCCWTSFPHDGLTSPFNPDKKILFSDSLFVQGASKINIKKRPLEDILKDPLWERLYKGFDRDLKTFVECEKKCKPCSVNSLNGKAAVDSL